MPIEENQDDSSSIEKKFKLSFLQMEKRLLDLEVALSEIKDKLKDFDATNLAELKQRLEDVEDLAMLENVGILEFKKMMEEIKERLEDMKNINSNVVNLQNKITELERTHKAMSEIDTKNIPEQIKNIKNELDILNKKKVEIELKIADFENKFAILEDNLKKSLSDTLLNEIKLVKKDLLSQITRVEAVESVTKNISNEVNKMELELKKFESLDKLIDLSKDVEEKIEIIKFLENEIRRISSKVETIYENLSTEIEKIKSFETKLELINESVDKVKRDLDNTKISILEKVKRSDIEGILYRMSELEKEFESLKIKERLEPVHAPTIGKIEMNDILNRIIFLETRISTIEKILEEMNKIQPIIIE
ncbi:MAG: hypothetical protein QW156_00800 [Candidatus Aenigmatarchaeota archaeon]